MKKKIFVLIFSGLVGLSANAQVPTNGIVAYYPFNGNANDASGFGNNGTVNGAMLTTDRFLNNNSAYNFNGSSNFIQVPNSTYLQNTTEITISAWINITNWYNQGKNSYAPIVCKSNTTQMNYQLNCRNDNKLEFSFLNNNWTANYSDGFVNNKWYYVAISIKNGTPTAYVNGLIYSSTLVSNTLLQNVQTDLYIGYDPIGLNEFLNGKLDDIRIYNRALNSSEVMGLYQEGICKTSTTVTDTLYVKAILTGFNPLTYQNTIRVYPNSTMNEMIIDCGTNFNSIGSYVIKISNSLGQTVFQSQITQQKTTLNMNGWTGKGIYILELIDNNGNAIENKKIVLQ